MRLGRDVASGETQALGGWAVLLLSVFALAGCQRDLRLPEARGIAQGTGGAQGGGAAEPGDGDAGAAGEAVRGSGGGAPSLPDSATTSNRSRLVASSQQVVFDEDAAAQAIELEGHGQGASPDDLRIVVEGQPRLGTLSHPEHPEVEELAGPAPLSLSYTPNQHAFGDDSLTFYVEDSQGNRSENALVSIRIRPVNDAPVAVPDSEKTGLYAAVRIDVLANDWDIDNDADELSVLSWTEPSAGSVQLEASGAFLFTPKAGYQGKDSFSYTVTDGSLTADARVEIDVDPDINNANDWDEDGIPNNVEDSLGSDPLDADSDDDGVPDGVEDANQNGQHDPGETSVTDPDSDDDGRCDGLRIDNDGDKDENGDPLDPSDGCQGPVLVDAGSMATVPDGLSWATAFTTLQDGLDEADGKRDVWVADGRYTGNAPLAAVGVMPPGTQCFGGFSGGETYLQERDQSSLGTILDGDFGANDDQGTPESRQDNSASVVVFQADGSLDGFAVRNGELKQEDARAGAGVTVTEGFVRLVNNEFRNNKNQLDGGAVGCVETCALTLENSWFWANEARTGGAVYVATAGGVVLSGVSFYDNLADVDGGAVAVPTALSFDATDLVLENNRSDHDGGAVYLGGVTAVLETSLFKHNVASNYGGGLFNAGELMVVDTQFEGNQAAFGGAMAHVSLPDSTSVLLETVVMVANSVTSDGGALYNRNAAVEVQRSTISNNHAGRFGGGILHQNSQLTVEHDTQIAENEAGSAGGGVRVLSGSSSFAGVTLVENKAADGGAGLDHVAGSVDLIDVAFTDNEALASTNGGGMRCDGAACSFGEVVFTGNQGFSGAGLYCAAGAECTLSSTSFDSNHAEDAAGGVYCNGSDCHLDAVVFSDNTSSRTTGGIFCNASSCSVESSRFVRQRALYAAGMTCAYSSTCTLSDTSFASNVANEPDGAANKIAGQGGGLWCGNASGCTVTGGMFSDNQSDFGGGMFCTLADSRCDVSRSVFNGNLAHVSGGGLYHQHGELNLQHVAFHDNTANYGGGIVVFDTGDALIRSVAFLNNEQRNEGGGGALYTDGFPVVVDVRDVLFFGNSGQVGGAADHRGTSEVTYAGVTFANNDALGDGGAVRAASEANVGLTNVSFIENTAHRGGGLITTESAQTTLTNASFLANRAQETGGAIQRDSEAALTLLNAVLFDNTDGAGVSDLSLLGSGPARVEFTRSAQALAGPGHTTLLVTPFVERQGLELLLNPALPSAASGVDAGSNVLADDPVFGFSAVGSAPWSSLTTLSDNSLDQGIVDLGRHYATSRVSIESFDVSTRQLGWSVRSADECLWFNTADAEYGHIAVQDATGLVSGALQRTLPRSVELWLVCFDASGEPAVASATVP